MASKTLASLVVKIGADVTGVTAGLNTLDKRLRTTKKKFPSVTDSTLSLQSGLRLLAGAAGIGYVAKKIFDLGSGLEETASKFRTVFGSSAQDAQKFLDDFANTAGLSNVAGQEVMATTAAIVQGMGFGQKASAAFSQDIVKLAGDLTSFNDVPIEETSRAIQSALTGERESLKRLGIVILDADVKKKALAMTGKTLAASLTQEEKATATLALITERAGVAVGDLARTMDSPANKARRIIAEFMDLRDAIAHGLLPAFGAVLESLEGTAGGFKGMTDSIEGSGAQIAAWAKFAIEAFKMVAKAIAAPFRIAFNLGQVLGDLARIVGNVLVGDFAAANQAARDLATDFTDMGGVVTGLVGSFDNMRIASGEAWRAQKTGADAATAAIDRQTASVVALTGAQARMLSGAGMSGPGALAGFGAQTLDPEQLNRHTARRSLREARAGGITMPNVSALVPSRPGGGALDGEQGGIGGMISGVGATLKQGFSSIFSSFGPQGLALAAVFDILKGAMEPLQPVIEMLREPLRIVGTLIGQTLAPVLELFVPIVIGLAKAFTFGQQAMGYLVQALGWFIDHLVPDFISKVGQGMEQWGKDMVANSKAARKAMDAANDATDSFSDALKEATTNIPTSLPLAYLRQQIGAGGVPGNGNNGDNGNNGGNGRGGKGGKGGDDDTTVNYNIIINTQATDGARLLDEVDAELRRRKGSGQSVGMDRYYTLRPA